MNENLVDRSGRVVGQIRQDGNDYFIDIDLTILDSDINMDKPIFEGVDIILREDAEKQKMNMVYVLDKDKTQRCFACDDVALREDVFIVGSVWFLRGKSWGFDEDLLISRREGPAIVHKDGSVKWLLDGFLHKDDGPAIENADGSRFYFKNGKQQMATNLTSETSSCSIKVKIKMDSISETENINYIVFQSEDEYKRSCYRDSKDSKFKIKLGKWIDAPIHCVDGPAVEFSDGRVCFVIDGVSVDRSIIENNMREKALEEIEEQTVSTEDNSPGIMFSVACLAIAGLAGLVKNKKNKKARQLEVAQQPQVSVVEDMI